MGKNALMLIAQTKNLGRLSIRVRNLPRSIPSDVHPFNNVHVCASSALRCPERQVQRTGVICEFSNRRIVCVIRVMNAIFSRSLDKARYDVFMLIADGRD